MIILDSDLMGNKTVSTLCYANKRAVNKPYVKINHIVALSGARTFSWKILNNEKRVTN